jgi:hypothetical protein
VWVPPFGQAAHLGEAILVDRQDTLAKQATGVRWCEKCYSCHRQALQLWFHISKLVVVFVGGSDKDQL